MSDQAVLNLGLIAAMVACAIAGKTGWALFFAVVFVLV